MDIAGVEHRDDDNRTETLPVDDDRCALAGEADVLSRQPHERVGCGEREVDGGLYGVETGDVRALVGAALIGARRSGAEVDDLRTGRRRDVDGRRRDGAVRDMGRLEGERRRRAALREDRDPKRDPARRVEGELGRAEQAAVVLRRHSHRVRGLVPDVVRLSIRDGRLLRELGEKRRDLRERRGRARVRSCRRRVLREREAVHRVRRSVIRGDLVGVPDDLRVACARLKLEPAAAVVRRPEPAGCALRGRSRSASTGGGDRQGRAAGGDSRDRDDESDESRCRECPKELHSDPFSGSSSSVVAPELERFLRSGNSIVNRDPST